MEKLAKTEPTLTKLYYLKLRLDGFLQTSVEEMEARGLGFDEIMARLRKKYSRQTEQVWTDITAIRWATYATSQEFLMKFGALYHELKQVTAKENGVVD